MSTYENSFHLNRGQDAPSVSVAGAKAGRNARTSFPNIGKLLLTSNKSEKLIFCFVTHWIALKYRSKTQKLRRKDRVREAAKDPLEEAALFLHAEFFEIA